MVGIVVVSHSEQAAAGIVEIAAEMSSEGVRIEPVGGDPDGGVGTTVPAIEAAIERAADGEGVVVLVDLGSAVMNTEMAIETVDIEGMDEVTIADAPVLEGALNAAVEAASSKATVDSVADAAEEAYDRRKLS